MIDYMKFWLARELAEIGFVVAVLVAFAAVCFLIVVGQHFRAKWRAKP